MAPACKFWAIQKDTAVSKAIRKRNGTTLPRLVPLTYKDLIYPNDYITHSLTVSSSDGNGPTIMTLIPTRRYNLFLWVNTNTTFIKLCLHLVSTTTIGMNGALKWIL